MLKHLFFRNIMRSFPSGSLLYGMDCENNAEKITYLLK